ncbi:uncharacterized protein LOC128265839 [Drosophila gunungcola]|uniref:MADF domain-containing protein n=1 Tax=Drosophila gunungcola TaxID=103775 RepID=A0A9Q0BJ15_9MUSC|nr:uncharacterized protein LOC128265839 [Drosophila gunungcola]KAI8033229.1 hypothetical protein M5D96_014018 [Drosophila gunungcola]
MSKLSDTKIPITEFLEAYRRQPCLYNSLLDTYKNRVSREEAYEAIIRALKIPQLTVVDIKLKIKSVRTVYSKELRIWMREKELGRSYEPKLFWFKLADSFLRTVSLSHCKRSKNKHAGAPQTPVKAEESLVPSSKLLFTAAADISMSEDALEEEDEEQNGEGEECPPDHGKPPGSSCIISMATENARGGKAELIIDDSSLCLVDQQQQQHHHQGHPQQAPTTPAQRKLKYNTGLDSAGDDELMIFGQSIASQLRTITDSYSRSVAKLRIQQVLFEAETGQFQSTEVNSTQLQHTF